MRKTDEIQTAILVAVAASLLSGCHAAPIEARRCVDDQGRILPDEDCKRGRGGGAHFVYGGGSGGHIGDTVIGGRDEPSPGARVVTGEDGVSHGGFGSGHGGGEGE